MGVYVVKLPNGDLHLGAEVDGVFVSFASHSAGRVAQLVERGETLRDRAANGDELARDQIGKPLDGGNGSSKPVSKMTADELDAYADANAIPDYPGDATVAEKRAAIREHESTGEGS